jgi:hypothetical protein
MGSSGQVKQMAEPLSLKEAPGRKKTALSNRAIAEAAIRASAFPLPGNSYRIK